MAEAGEEQEIVLKAEMVELLSDLDGHELTVECTYPGDQNIIFSIAGSIASSIIKNFKCQECKDLYIASDVVPALTFIDDGNSTKHESNLLKAFEQRRPLYSYRPGVHLMYLYLELLLDTGVTRVTATSGLRLRQPQGDVCGPGENPHGRQQSLQQIPWAHYRQDHSFDTIFYQISKRIFNITTRNYVSQLNDAVRHVKRPNEGNKFAIQTRKIAKLTSNVA